MKASISIAASAITQFGELWQLSFSDLAKSVVKDVLEDFGKKTGQTADQAASEIQAVFVANKAASNYQRQHHLGAYVSDLLPHCPPATRIEGACASGGLALLAAEHALLSGTYDTVLVVGIEKMTDVSSAETTAILSGAADTEREYGSTFPALYALLASEHMRQFGTTREELSAVAVKNHRHALSNPKAQYHKEFTLEQVSNSQLISEPLRLLDCSPITDGAAAVVLTTKKVTKSGKSSAKQDSVQIVGFGHGQDTLTLADRQSLTELQATKRAVGQALQMAELTIDAIKVAEVHDCFTIAELLAVEDLGFVKKGDAGSATLQNQVPALINPSGGLKACGHPVGATGVKQLAYLHQFLLDPEKSASITYGLTHNVGGSGATAVVHIIRKGTQ